LDEKAREQKLILEEEEREKKTNYQRVRKGAQNGIKGSKKQRKRVKIVKSRNKW